MASVPSKSIVLVDDEKSYTDLMADLLAQNLDCSVHGFVRPLAALEALPRLNPAVVVTDYFMPQLNGLEFVRQAVPVVPAAAFLLITAHSLVALQDELSRLQAVRATLAKPFGWRRLAEEILRVWPATVATPTYRADATSL